MKVVRICGVIGWRLAWSAALAVGACYFVVWLAEPLRKMENATWVGWLFIVFSVGFGILFNRRLREEWRN